MIGQKVAIRRISKLVGSLLGSAAIALMAASPVLAVAVNTPDSIAINSVYAYHNLATSGDQLYLIDYNINYVTPPLIPTSETFLVRLLASDNSSLSITSPYPYQNLGYGRGIVAVYFSAGTAPAWGDNYTVQLIGNPLQTWNGTAPMTLSSIYWSTSITQSASQEELATSIMALANSISADWGGVSLVVSTSVGVTLSTTGQSYFCAVIPGLQQMAPAAFSSYLSTPEVHKITYDNTYATGLAASLYGTPLDFRPLAAKLGWSIGWTNSMMVFVGIFVLDALLVWKVLKTTKGLLLIDDTIFIGASVMGMLPLVVMIGVGILAAFLTFYVIFYQKSGA